MFLQKKKLNIVRHLTCWNYHILVTDTLYSSLALGIPRHLLMGTLLRQVTLYMTIFMDAVVMGWGRLLWHSFGRHMVIDRNTHLLGVHLLVHFFSLTGDSHVWGQKTALLWFTSKDRKIWSTALLKLAESLWIWASEHLWSLRAIHVPSLENRGTDLMSRGSPAPGEWRPQACWACSGKVEVDLCPPCPDSVLCKFLFFLTAHDDPHWHIRSPAKLCRTPELTILGS